MQSHWNLHTLPVRMQTGTATVENGLAVSYKVKHICITYDPATLLLIIYPREIKHIYTKTCIGMFTDNK